jgi:hypothetical protein
MLQSEGRVERRDGRRRDWGGVVVWLAPVGWFGLETRGGSEEKSEGRQKEQWSSGVVV